MSWRLYSEFYQDLNGFVWCVETCGQIYCNSHLDRIYQGLDFRLIKYIDIGFLLSTNNVTLNFLFAYLEFLGRNFFWFITDDTMFHIMILGFHIMHIWLWILYQVVKDIFRDFDHSNLCFDIKLWLDISKVFDLSQLCFYTFL